MKELLNYLEKVDMVIPLIRITTVSVLLYSGLLIADMLDIPSLLIVKLTKELFCFIIGSIGLIILLWLIEHSYHKTINMSTITHVDAGIICMFTSSLIWRLFYTIYVRDTSYKSCLSFFLMIISIGLIMLRTYRCSNQHNQNERLYDLKDILNNEFSLHENEPLLIAEKDVDYDFLNRNTTINQLYSTIIHFHSDRSFVIGLCGEWGSGKTTIINNVKRLINENNKEVVVIDDFDPWIFGTRDALLLSMYEKILQTTGVKYSVLKSRRIATSLKQTFGDLGNTLTKSKEIGSLYKELSSPNGSFDQISAIKNEMTMYLHSLDKPVVFFIDNIDRAEAGNIVFLFKLIGTIFDLPNILYILSYDPERVKDLINDTAQINPKYIEKIVQQEIRIPTVQKEQLKAVYQVCTRNILQQYGVDFESDKLYDLLCNVFCNNVNVRNYKRLVNSVFTSVFHDPQRLDISTLFALESIKFLAPDLYEQIRMNRKYYISKDTIYDEEIRFCYFNKEQFNKEGQNFYEQLENQYPQYIVILSELFPYAYRFSKHEELILQYSHDNDRFNRKCPIHSAKYFELYFSYGSNEFSAITESVETMIKQINVSEKKEVGSIIKSNISQIDKEWQREWFEVLQLNIEEIEDSTRYTVLNVLWSCLDYIDDDIVFMPLSARQRALVIIAKLVSFLTEKEVSAFYKRIRKMYRNLSLIRQLLYWMEADNKQGPSDNKNFESLKRIYSGMCEEIITNKVDLYDSNYYCHGNIYCIIDYYCGEESNEVDASICQEYFNSIFLNDYVYRFLADCVRSSRSGSVYGYSIRRDAKLFQFINKERIDDAIRKRAPKAEIERIVLKLYREYCVSNDDFENQYFSPNPLAFNL